MTDGDAISRSHLLAEIAKLKTSPWFNENYNGAKLVRKEAVVAHKIAPYEVFDGEDELLEEMLTDIRETCGEIIEDDNRRSNKDH